MRVEYDREADAVYVWLRELPYAYGKDLDESRRLDYAADHQPIGVELLDVSAGVDLRGLPDSEAIAQALARYKTAVTI